MPDKTVIIGAGLGGLAAAALLAASGRRVVLFERNSRPGGKMEEFQSGGYRFDTGPSLLTLPDVLRDLFNRCNEDLDHYLEWSEPDPLCRYFYPDGTLFNNYRDQARSVAEIKKFAPEDSLAYGRFLEYAGDLYQKTKDTFLYNPLCDRSDLKGLKLTDFFRIDPFTTVSDRVDSFFRSGYMRTYIKRFTTYTGSSPFQAPATLNVIPHIEISLGGYYVKGGMYKVAGALEKLARKKGASIRYDSGVRRILTAGGEVNGIELDNGGKIECSCLVSNSDVSETLLHLLDPVSVSLPDRKMQKRQEPSSSGFILLLGTDRSWEQLHHHNVFFSPDYKNEFRQIFHERRMPDDPTLYISNTSVSDPGDAPENGSNLFILVNAPYLADGQDWVRTEAEYPSLIVNKLERSGLTGLSQSIQLQEVITPADFHAKFRSNRGSIYGTSSNSRFSAFFRSRNKLRGISGLYLTGGSVHPGGGIPLVILSAMHVAELIERYEKKPVTRQG